ncbi:MAG: class I SAM-dependent methyltransferase [Clostridiaceae bacterium]|nr:class I SAM-dependent methyltransferase [Clostridiaceae bacterium]
MECYKEFARIYDELINNDIDYFAFANFILDACERYLVDRESYLDLACGTGNLTINIFNSFKLSFGVDMSMEMLTEAEKKVRNNSCKPKFICQDICKLNVNNKFDLITCCLDSINYITEKESLNELFFNVKQHLKPEGLFIFDINSYYKIKNILGNNTFTYDSEEVFYVWENRFEDEIVDMYLNFFIKEGETYHRVDEEHSERAYPTDFILQLLKEVGLECLELVDCYQSKEINLETERITFVVKHI